MQINYTVTENDYVQYNLFHHKNSPSTKNTVMIMRFILPAILLVLGLLSIRHHNWAAWLPLIIIAVVWVCITPGFFRRGIAKNVKKLMYEGRCSEFIGDFSLTLSADHICYAGNGQTLKSAYYRVERIEHDNERLYIYLGSLTAIIIPKAAFKDAAEKQAFLDLLVQRLTDNGRS